MPVPADPSLPAHPQPAQLLPPTFHNPPAMQYYGGEPCAICGHRLEMPAGCAAGAAPLPAVKPPSAFPSEIVPGFLFLGSYDHASRHEILKTLGIGNILNVSLAAAACWLCAALRAPEKHGLTAAAAVPLAPLPRADGAQLPGAVQELLHLPHSVRQPAATGRVLLLPRCARRLSPPGHVCSPVLPLERQHGPRRPASHPSLSPCRVQTRCSGRAARCWCTA